MNKNFKKIINWLITLSAFGILTYFFLNDLSNLKNRFYQRFLPCQQPITYQLDEIDQHFDISQKNLLTAVAAAEQIWEKPSGLNLFEYAPSGTLKINLIYDYRQDATLKLKQLDIVVKNDQTTYDKLKIQFASLQKSYQIDKENLDKQSVELDSHIAIYNAEIKNLNRKGNISPAKIETIHTEEIALNKLLSNFKTQQNIFNNTINEINTLAITLNRLAQTLNLSVDHYNTVGTSRGEEFKEGEYISSSTGQEINIYQFDDNNKLVRVLAHELGHALGLEHVSSTKAMMYYLNNGINEKLLPEDILQLKQRCNIK